MIDIGFNRIDSNWKSNLDLSTKHSTIHKLIETYIEKPQELRNKIAHGQWIVAFNSNNTNINSTTTSEINLLDQVKLSVWFQAHQHLCYIIRDLIQSPTKAFNANFDNHYNNLNEWLKRTANRTINRKKAKLQTKEKKREKKQPS